MKLNIGCGHNYLKGYLNVDVSADSLADAVMEAHDLLVDSSSVDGITASQLLEHLGFFKGKYFLAECFRVLRPGGTLRLETPHLERTFEIFLAGDRRGREAALTWLYGAETPHMQHRFCFPLELLLELAHETGFDPLHHESFLYQENRPSLRLILQKPAGRERHQFMAELRKRLVMEEIPAFDDEITMAGQEELLRRIAGALGSSPPHILELSLHSAEIVREFYALRCELGAPVQEYLEAATRLAENHFQRMLLAMLKDQPEGGGRQSDACEGTLRQGRAIIRALLAGEDIQLPPIDGEPLRVFSEPVLKALADRLYARGIKEFMVGEYGQALESLGESCRIFRDNPFTWWNRARLHGLCRNAEAARHDYEMALAALAGSPAGMKRAYREMLLAEMGGVAPPEPVDVMGKEGSA
uniref:Methyltransferase domain-containing protein n=1 Tax=Geobacter metallireducens TaxID=28232 RepID=A0A831XFK6_GEOME